MMISRRHIEISLAVLCLCGAPSYAAGDFDGNAMQLSDILKLSPQASVPAAAPADVGANSAAQPDRQYRASRAEKIQRWQEMVRSGEFTQADYADLVGALNGRELMKSASISMPLNIARWQGMLKSGKLTQADYDCLIKNTAPKPQLSRAERIQRWQRMVESGKLTQADYADLSAALTALNQ